MSDKFRVLTTRHLSLITAVIAGPPGIEPGNGGFKGPCLTAWLRPKVALPFYEKIGAAATREIISTVLDEYSGKSYGAK